MRIQQVVCVLAFAGFAQAGTPYESDFDDGTVGPEITLGAAFLTGVQGYADLGVGDNTFTGLFLRSPTQNTVRVELTDLPTHSTIDIAFLFAAIDSLDGTGTPPAGDFFIVTVDGVEVFNESFANALKEQIQSYQPPAGGELARRVPLGFTVGEFYLDSAYDMYIEPAFRDIPHSADSVVIEFRLDGDGVQDLNDESWALENLRVSTDGDSSCPGDVNFDGSVDLADLNLVLANFGQTTPNGDATGDGVVDLADLNAVLAAFGASCP